MAEERDEQTRRDPKRPDRREFLIRGSATALALGMAPVEALAAPAEPPRVRGYRTLGRTGLEISDISFGSSRTADPRMAAHAFSRGVTYFDTAEGYQSGASEQAIGEALHDKRDRIVIASKVKCQANTTRDQLMSRLEGSLRRLRTDRIDVYFNHAVNDLARLRNDAWQEFTLRAKQQGKIRYTGVSGHGGQLASCLDYAIDNDLADVFLVAYNFGQDPGLLQQLTKSLDFIAVTPELPQVLARAREKGIGVVAMKTLRGARKNDMQPYERPGGTFAQAAFRWVLSSPLVDALIISMNSTNDIDEYLGASGAAPPGPAELGLLKRYLAQGAGSYCEHGCSVCEASCPAGIAISEVLRTRMYHVDYGDAAHARTEFAALGLDASVCGTCPAPCQSQCPGGLPVADLMRDAHRRLA